MVGVRKCSNPNLIAEHSGVDDEDAQKQASQLHKNCIETRRVRFECWPGLDVQYPNEDGEDRLGVDGGLRKSVDQY